MESLSLGKHNPKLADIRKAIQHATLTREGLLPIEGPKLIEEALKSGLEVLTIFKRHGVALPIVPNSIPVYDIDPTTFKTVQSTETSQGVIALVRPRQYRLADLVSPANPLIVVLARLQDPGNVGTILRVAEWFGANGCVATVGTASVLNPKTIRASAGSVFRLPHVWDMDVKLIMSALKATNIRVLGTAPSARRTIDQWDWREPTAVVIGNEGSGLSDEEIQLCDSVVRIPHQKTVESLNSAIAAAIILYEASRQRSSR